MKFRNVHQLLPTLVDGDAIGEQVLLLRDTWKSRGLDGGIFALTSTLGRSHGARPMSALSMTLHNDEAVVYHHSTGSEAAKYYAALTGGTKIMVYHNITPPALLNHAPAMAACSHWGLEQLDMLATHTRLAVADSRFNAAELQAAGFDRIEIVPLVPSGARRGLFEKARSNRTRTDADRAAAPVVLFVGRVVPHKGIEDVIRVFRQFQERYHPAARLRIVGSTFEAPAYADYLGEIVQSEGCSNVEFTGKVTGEPLGRLYEEADIYLSMSRHEGFCLPLVEAMLAGIPVIAADAGAVAETLDGSALLFSTREYPEYVEAMRLMIADPAARMRVVEAQYARAAMLNEGLVAERWDAILGELTARCEQPAPEAG